MLRLPIEQVRIQKSAGGLPISTVVTNALREKILHGALPGGQRLRQDAVAAQFGVSQTIVREAFRQLVNEGVLKSEPRRGVSVATMSADEVQEMTELRSVIEAKALAWAIPRLSQEDLDTASRIVAELDKAKSIDRLIALNDRFHHILYAASQRQRTLGIIDTLRLNFERYLRFMWDETHRRAEYHARFQEDHRQILELCVKKDIEGACSLLSKHIEASGTLLVEQLKART